MIRYRYCIRLILGILFIIVFTTSVAHSRTISFAGRKWTVKTGTGAPGPNYWSDSSSSVWVDSSGLHLKIRKVGST